jgi:hypothetical protein
VENEVIAGEDQKVGKNQNLSFDNILNDDADSASVF